MIRPLAPNATTSALSRQLSRPRHGIRALLAASLLTTAFAAGAQTSTDAWDVAQGNAVTSISTAHPAGLPAGMFGADAGAFASFPVERLNTLFGDLLPVGTVHSIEWHTAAPISLTGYHLLANADSVDLDVDNGRSFSQFKLYAEVDGNFQLISSVNTAVLYNAGLLDVQGHFAAVGAQNFRAEFTQLSGLFAKSGPRVVELDAITAAVPEPASWALMLAGGAALLARRRRG